MAAPGEDHSDPARADQAEEAAARSYYQQLISLFLLLIVLFLVLNSIADRQGVKELLATHSVTSVFATRLKPLELRRDDDSPDAIELRGFLAIKRAVEEAQPRSRVRLDTAAHRMEVALAADVLFPFNAVTARPLQALFDALAMTALAPRPGLAYSLDIAVCANRPAEQPGSALAAQRAGELARILYRRGVPAEAMTAGVRDCGEGQVVMTFRGEPGP